jgi:prepilin-type N-terminal cleavage/methylation domain-containing protein/prepilin-type processing-associated H-X9-DG protein
MTLSIRLMQVRPVRRGGFTLIELLVVISIISLLVAILLPALAGARTRAVQAACLAQTRQIMMGALMYANDNKSKLPSNQNNTTAPYGVCDKPWTSSWGTGDPYRFFGLCVSYVQYSGFFCPANANATWANRKVDVNQVAGVTVMGANSARGGYAYRFVREDGSSANGVSSEGARIPVASLDLGQRFAAAQTYLGYGAGYRLPPAKTALLGDLTWGYRSSPIDLGIVKEVHETGGNAAYFDGHGAFRPIQNLVDYSPNFTANYFTTDARVSWLTFLFMYDLR